MAEVKKVEGKPVDQSGYEWVVVPKEDVLGNPHPAITVNRSRFEPGLKYWVDAEMAGEVKRIIADRFRHDRRVLNPRADAQTMAQLHRSNPSRHPNARVASEEELASIGA